MIHIKIDWFKYSKLNKLLRNIKKTDAKKTHIFEKKNAKEGNEKKKNQQISLKKKKIPQ